MYIPLLLLQSCLQLTEMVPVALDCPYWFWTTHTMSHCPPEAHWRCSAVPLIPWNSDWLEGPDHLGETRSPYLWGNWSESGRKWRHWWLPHWEWPTPLHWQLVHLRVRVGGWMMQWWCHFSVTICIMAIIILMILHYCNFLIYLQLWPWHFVSCCPDGSQPGTRTSHCPLCPHHAAATRWRTWWMSCQS